MMRGEIWWVDFGLPCGSEPGYKRPMLIIQDDAFNQSKISTIISVAITSNTNLAGAPGNVLLTKKDTGLTKPSVVNVSQVVTLDRERFSEKAGKLSRQNMNRVDSGIKLVLNLI